MLLIPFETPVGGPCGPVVLVAIFQSESLDRMHSQGTLDLHCCDYHGFLPLDRPIRELNLFLAQEDDVDTIMAFKRGNDLSGLLAWLKSRGQARLSRTGLPET